MMWGAIGVLTATGIGIITGLWRVGRIITGWRAVDAQKMGQLAHLFARWMDATDEHLVVQDRELYDMKSRVHELEKNRGLHPLPPLPSRPVHVNRQMEASEVFGPPADFGISDEPSKD